jgi:LysM repeat protein
VESNGISDPNLIRVGDVLDIPGSWSDDESKPSQTYVVQEGDTLSDVAIRFETTVDALMAANGLQTSLIVIGRELAIPPAPVPIAAAPVAVEVPVLEIPSERPQDPELEAIFDEVAAAEGVDPGIVRAMAWVESGWDQGARSPAGATGVMQLMPGTIGWLETRVFGEELNEDVSVYDNVKAGVRYLKIMQDLTRSPERALVAYYQGPGVTQQGILYSETQRYLDAVLATKARHWP